MRPTRGASLAVLVAGVLHLLARQTGVGWLELGSAGALALPVTALLMRPRTDGLTVTAAPLLGRLGEPLSDRWVVRAAGRATPPLLLTDGGPGLVPVSVAVPALQPGDQVVAELVREPARRGHDDTRPLVVTALGPFGLLRTRRTTLLTGAVAVAPRSVPAAAGALDGAGSRGRAAAVAGAGTEVLGLRPWRAGDGASALSARATARHGRPVVLERERDSGPVLVVLCTAPGSGPAWEAAVERSCALAEASVRAGGPVVLLAAGLPAPARPDRAAVLRWHAALDGCAPLDAATASAARRAAGGGQVRVLGPAPTGLRAVPA